MAMPEASMDKNGDFRFGKYQIGRTGQVTPVQPVPITKSSGSLAYRNFGFGIPATNAAHHSGTGSGCDDIHNVSWSRMPEHCKSQMIVRFA